MSLRPILAVCTCVFAISALSASHAMATDGSTGFADLFTQFFGTEDSRKASSDCSASDHDPHLGMIGAVNNIFCHLEKDMGIKGLGSATKTFAESSGGSVSVHCDVTNPGGAYQYTASCWACAGAACNTTAAFSRLLNMSWSYVADKSTNKGVLIMDNGAFNGSPGVSGMSFSWDLGTATSAKNLNARVVSSGFQMNVAAQKSSTVLSAEMVFANMRFAVATDESANVALADFQQVGAGACTNGFEVLSAGTAPSGCSICLSRQRLSDDWSYTPVGAGNCTGLSLSAFPDTAANVGAYTADATQATTVLNQSINATVWNGMGAHPGSL